MKITMKPVSCLLLILFYLGIATLSNCRVDREAREYYSNTGVFETVTITIADYEYITYEKGGRYLEITADEVPTNFPVKVFSLHDETLDLVRERGWHPRVRQEIVITVAPGKSAWTYPEPIVALWVGDEQLLSFEEGYAVLMEMWE